MSSHEENCPDNGVPEMIEIDSDDDPSIGLLMSVDDGDVDSPQTMSKSLVAAPKCVWPKGITPKYVVPKRIRADDTSQLISKEFKVKGQKLNINEQKPKQQKLMVIEQKPKEPKLKINEQKQGEQKLKVNEPKPKEHFKLEEDVFPLDSMTGLTAGRGAYQCQLCIKSFTSTQQLTQHSLVHSNLRKHQCPFCEKTFKQLSHVQQHQRIHTGELPYRCSFENCQKSFRQSSSLKQHMKGHTRGTVDSTAATDQPIPSVAKRRKRAKRSNKSYIKIEEQEREGYEEHPANEEQQEQTDDDRFPNCLTSLPPSPVSEQCGLVPEESLPSSSNKKRARKTLNDSVDDIPDDIDSDDVKVEPIHRQSLVSLSSKLEEISKRERSLRFSTDQLLSGKKPLQ